MIADKVVARGLLRDPLLRAAIAQNCRLRLHRERRRGLDALERRVDALERKVDALSKPKRSSSARKPAGRRIARLAST